jgi:hypothetical protein
MSLPTPGEARLRQISINGLNLAPYIIEFSISESIFQPFRTAEMTFIDNNNIMKQLKLQGNEDKNQRDLHLAIAKELVRIERELENK